MSPLSAIASLFSIASMALYTAILLRGSVTPNPATWIIWLVIGVINLSSYIFVIHGDASRALPLAIVVCGIFIVTIYSLVKGKFSRLKPLDFFCFGLAVGVGIFWRLSGNPVVANLLLQVVYVVSFVPTIAGLRAKTLQETPLPWSLAFVAYALMICEIVLHWQGSTSWVALVHPVVNGLIGNGAVAYFSLRTLPKIQIA